MEIITELIGNYAFPICACVAMFWYMNEERKSHAEESKAMTDAINKLEIAITNLVARLDN